MLWRKKPLVSDTLADWIADSFDWVDLRFGPDWFSKRPLIVPTKDYFSAGKDDIDGLALDIAHALGHKDPFHILPIQNLPADLRYDPTAMAAIAGQYYDDDVPLITYDPALKAYPLALINTLAHEIMHARLAPFEAEMPGGAAAHELSTDLHCITHGMGLFALEGPAQTGWSGYMTLESRAWALAAFLQRTGRSVADVQPWLSARSLKAVKKAAQQQA